MIIIAANKKCPAPARGEHCLAARPWRRAVSAWLRENRSERGSARRKEPAVCVALTGGRMNDSLQPGADGPAGLAFNLRYLLLSGCGYLVA